MKGCGAPYCYIEKSPGAPMRGCTCSADDLKDRMLDMDFQIMFLRNFVDQVRQASERSIEKVDTVQGILRIYLRELDDALGGLLVLEQKEEEGELLL